MKIGIFGGTFNPIHTGHINASLEFYDRVGLSRLYVIPDRIPPHKEGGLASGKDRLCMLKLVYENSDICGGRDIVVSDMELLRRGKSYTYETVLKMRELFPEDELYLYVGSDMYYTLESWYRGVELLTMCSFAVAPRYVGEREKILEYAKMYSEKYRTKSIFLDIEPRVISSTEIREAIVGKSCNFTKKLLTDEVERYIMENKLYCE